MAALVDRLIQEAELLAVYTKTPLPAVKLWRLAQKLAAEVGREVGLVDFPAASSVMWAQIIHEGGRIYRAEEVACETFEDCAYSSCALLNDALQDPGVVGCKTRWRVGL